MHPAPDKQQLLGGMFGLLVGDALGVPYEFHEPGALPPMGEIEMAPPAGFPRSYAHIAPGTWSDDGAQALCLLASLLECGQYHPHDFAARLLAWHESGHMAVDNYVFDVGNQTSASIQRLRAGATPGHSGLSGERNNGNGSLMRCLPLALLHRGGDDALASDAMRQSRLTHAHPRSQLCCALHCLWARREIQRHPDACKDAATTLRRLIAREPALLRELDEHILPEREPGGTGTGYVVDCLHSARLACTEPTYESVVRRAVSLGHDTDTTACVAGGIAGIRHGLCGIPPRWTGALRGGDILRPLLADACLRLKCLG